MNKLPIQGARKTGEIKKIRIRRQELIEVKE